MLGINNKGVDEPLIGVIKSGIRTFSRQDAERLADSFWNNSPPVFSIAFQNEDDQKWATTISNVTNKFWEIIQSKFESFEPDRIDVDHLWAAQGWALNKIEEMFLEVPSELRDQANFADARLWYTLNLFGTLSHEQAFEKIVEEMQLLQYGMRSIYECRKRYEENHIGKQIVQLRASRDPRFPCSQDKLWKKLLTDLRPALWQFYLPNQAKNNPNEHRDDIITDTITKIHNSLIDHSITESIRKSIKGEFEYLPRTVKNAARSKRRNQKAQKRQPEEGFLSLDDEIKQSDGSKTPIIELLVSEKKVGTTSIEQLLSLVLERQDEIVSTLSHGRSEKESLEIGQRCFKVFVLRLQEYTIKEIAQIFNESENGGIEEQNLSAIERKVKRDLSVIQKSKKEIERILYG